MGVWEFMAAAAAAEAERGRRAAEETILTRAAVWAKGDDLKRAIDAVR